MLYFTLLNNIFNYNFDPFIFFFLNFRNYDFDPFLNLGLDFGLVLRIKIQHKTLKKNKNMIFKIGESKTKNENKIGVKVTIKPK